MKNNMSENNSINNISILESNSKDEIKREKQVKREERRIFGYRFSTILLICYFVSFLGWWVENIFRIIMIGSFSDRHQIFPFLAAYGFGIFFLFCVFGTPTEMRFFKIPLMRGKSKKLKGLSITVYFLMIFAIILFGEMGMGLLFEKLFGIKAWNYNDIPWHITQYTSIPTTFAFSTGITLIMQFLFYRLMNLIERIPSKIAFWLALVLGIIILADYLIMIITGMITNKFPHYWEIKFW